MPLLHKLSCVRLPDIKNPQIRAFLLTGYVFCIDAFSIHSGYIKFSLIFNHAITELLLGIFMVIIF